MFLAVSTDELLGAKFRDTWIRCASVLTRKRTFSCYWLKRVNSALDYSGFCYLFGGGFDLNIVHVPDTSNDAG